MDKFTQSYILTALWASTDNSRVDGGDPLDDNYGPEDIHPDTLAAMTSDCARFQAIQRRNLVHYDAARSGHDFWLTRNRHGAGYWDGDYAEPAAEQLTDESVRFGAVHLYVGDDGMIHQGGV